MRTGPNPAVGPGLGLRSAGAGAGAPRRAGAEAWRESGKGRAAVNGPGEGGLRPWVGGMSRQVRLMVGTPRPGGRGVVWAAGAGL